MLIKLEDGRLKDVPISQVTRENYIVDEKERDTYHVMMEIVRYSPSDGRRLSQSSIQKFDAKIYKSIMERHLKLMGYTVTVLYDPTEYLQKVEDDARRRREALNAPRKSAEEQKQEFESAVRAAVAEEIAKLSKISKGEKDVNKRDSKTK